MARGLPGNYYQIERRRRTYGCARMLFAARRSRQAHEGGSKARFIEAVISQILPYTAMPYILRMFTFIETKTFSRLVQEYLADKDS